MGSMHRALGSTPGTLTIGEKRKQKQGKLSGDESRAEIAVLLGMDSDAQETFLGGTELDIAAMSICWYLGVLRIKTNAQHFLHVTTLNPQMTVTFCWMGRLAT